MSVNVKVNVVDANDNFPIFYPQSYAGTIGLDDIVGYTVVVVKATDRDHGEMGNVSYFITGGSGTDYFSIDQHSGKN